MLYKLLRIFFMHCFIVFNFIAASVVEKAVGFAFLLDVITLFKIAYL
jgi:hypothetical protein